MGALLPIPQFRETFGSGLVGSQAALISGMYTIGGVSALPFVGPCLDNGGRRFGMFIGCGCVVLGTIIGGTANQLVQFLASRFILGKEPTLYELFRAHLKFRLGIHNCRICSSNLCGRDQSPSLP